MTGPQSARAAPKRILRALGSNPGVNSLRGGHRDGDWHAGMVASNRSWESEPAVIQSHVMERPNFFLTLHTTERVEKVPSDATCGGSAG